jgi:hypothetical protein
MRIARDKWKSTDGMFLKYDKIEHGVGSLLLFWLLSFLFLSTTESASGSFLAGVAWELKDGHLPYEKWGWFGGEGFSIKDIAANSIGISFGVYLELMIAFPSSFL